MVSSNNHVSHKPISLKESFSYDERWLLVNKEIEKILKKYWLPKDLINYYLDAHDNIRNEWKKIKPSRISWKLNDSAEKTLSGYEKIIFQNFSFEDIHHIVWPWILKAASMASVDWSIETEFPLNSFIRDYGIKKLLSISEHIKKWIEELQWISNNATERVDGKELYKKYKEKALMLSEEHKGNIPQSGYDIIDEKKKKANDVSQYNDSITYLIGYLKIIQYEIKKYDLEVNISINLLKRAYGDDITDVFNNKKQ